MYATRKMPGSLQGIESLNFATYWNAIKNKIFDLQQLPTMAVNHAMKLGIVVSKLQAMGRQDLVETMQLEIRKVNDDITKAWKVKGYLDQWLPHWLEVAAAQAGGTPVVAAPAYAGDITPPVPTIESFGIRQEPEGFGPGQPQVYVEPSLPQQIAGWMKSLVGLNDFSAERIPQERGLGFLPLIAVAVSIPALAYIVTTGMALYQDYVMKKDLTAEVILGKLTSGQVKDILTNPRPPEMGGMFSNIATGIGTNIGTMAVVGVVGYLAFMYFMTPKRGD